MKKYQVVVYIGRFQPFHNGHQETLKEALEYGEQVIVGIGSANRSRSTENPWTYDERVQMISESMDNDERIHFVPISDYPYNDTAWITHVNTQIQNYIEDVLEGGQNIGLIGFKKDDTSRYLESFPDWDFIGVNEQHGIMNAIDVRNQYFARPPTISEFLPDAVRAAMKVFAVSVPFKWLINEFDFIRVYPKLWGKGPFITVDAVVEQMGYVLLVTRKEPPFKGKLAIPGGFVNLNEWIAKARVRELKEETRIADSQGEIPPAKLMSFMTKEKVYDDPARSKRGRIVTFAGLYKLPTAKQLYSVVGSDDAEKAAWYKLSDLNASMLMEDHWFIINDMLGLTEGI
jgi:bifunctional NMN adenylyltransferase/nudix hydrolase